MVQKTEIAGCGWIESLFNLRDDAREMLNGFPVVAGAYVLSAASLGLKHAKLTAFGSTRFAKNPVHEDRNVLALVEAATPAVAIFGKTWDLHVKRALGITHDA